MCSNCSGDYEDPDVTNPPAEDEPPVVEQDFLMRALLDYLDACKEFGAAWMKLGKEN